MKSFLHLYTGNGKGKTTALMGMILRAMGYNKKIVLYQFLKGRQSGEIVYLEKNCPNVIIKKVTCNDKFFWEMTEIEKECLQVEMEKALKEIKIILKEGKCEFLILDEILDVVENKLLTQNEVEELLDIKGETEIVMSGRSAWESLEEKAGLHSEIVKKKHYFDNKVEAREGIEY